MVLNKSQTKYCCIYIKNLFKHTNWDMPFDDMNDRVEDVFTRHNSRNLIYAELMKLTQDHLADASERMDFYLVLKEINFLLNKDADFLEMFVSDEIK